MVPRMPAVPPLICLAPGGERTMEEAVALFVGGMDACLGAFGRPEIRVCGMRRLNLLDFD